MSDMLSIASSLGEKVQLLPGLTAAERAVFRSQLEQLAADLVDCCGIEPGLGTEALKIQTLVASLFCGTDLTETVAGLRQALGRFAAQV